MTREDTARHEKTREDTTRHEKARQGTRRHDKAREGTARHEKARARGHGARGHRMFPTRIACWMYWRDWGITSEYPH